MARQHSQTVDRDFREDKLNDPRILGQCLKSHPIYEKGRELASFHAFRRFPEMARRRQVFQTVYYFSARPRKDVVFDNVSYHRVAPPRVLNHPQQKLFQVTVGSDHTMVTERERSFVDCLMFPDYGGGVDELDKSLAMFPSFDFDVALEYLKLLCKPWLYSRLGFLLDRHADRLFFRGNPREKFLRHLPSGVAYLGTKRPGNRWVPGWKLMVPERSRPILNV